MAFKIVRKKGHAPVRIMVFGTFDIVHPGHRNFFKQARALSGSAEAYLIVSLGREKNVERIKGRKPTASESKRLAQVKALPEVNRAVLGAIGNHMPHIVKEHPDIIALGYDQTAYVRGLRASLKKAGLTTKIIRLNAHKPHLYKTSIIKAKSGKK